MDWNDNLKIDVEFIDNQHKRLVTAINKLQASLTTNYVNLQMSETLKFLVSYTQHHFSEEEDFMKSVGYPSYEQHLKLHKKLIAEIKDILIKIRNKTPVNADELIEFLVGWLKNHILEEDKKIKIHLQKIKSKGNTPHKNIAAGLKKSLILKLNELKKIFKGQLITDKEYASKKSHLLHDFICLQVIESKIVFDKNLSFLQDLLTRELIETKDYHDFLKQLFEAVNLEEVLNKIENNVEKFEYLNFCLKLKLITNKVFQDYKKNIIDNL